MNYTRMNAVRSSGEIPDSALDSFRLVGSRLAERGRQCPHVVDELLVEWIKAERIPRALFRGIDADVLSEPFAKRRRARRVDRISPQIEIERGREIPRGRECLGASRSD